MTGIDPDLHRQLMATLRRCDAFASNAELRVVFVDGRLSLWAYNVPEGESTASRVQATIAFLHDKANTQGQSALVLFLYVLQDRYDPNDAYFSELGALIARLDAPSSSPSPTASPVAADPYTPYETAMHTLLSRLGKDHSRYNEALIYQQRLNENLQGTRLYGDTETRRAERAEILARLNALTMKTLGTVFSDLGGAPAAAAASSAPVGGITIIDNGNVIGSNNQVSANKPPTSNHTPTATPGLSDRAYVLKLLNLLTKHFILDELNTLCFAVGVNYDELSGSGLTGKARELITYCERHTCMPALIDTIKALRPELDWL